MSLADGLRYMSEIKLDGATTTRLKVDEQQPFRSSQHVSWVRFAMQQLLA